MTLKKVSTRLLLVMATLVWTFNSYALDYDSLYEKALQLRYSNTDSAKALFVKCLKHYDAQNDTAKVAAINLKLIQIYSGSGNYQKAYDVAWSLLPIVRNKALLVERIDLNFQLTSLYIIFDQFEKANLHWQEAINDCDRLEDQRKKDSWLSRLYGVKAWIITKNKGDFESAEKWLLRAIDKRLNSGAGIYLKMQLAELYTLNDKLNASEVILKEIEKESLEEREVTNSLLFDHLGQLNMKKGNYDSAIFYFQSCLKSIDYFKNHLDNKVEVLDSLSSCYHYVGQNEKAFEYSKKSRLVNDRLFGSRSSINKQLFEIKNQYEERLKKQELMLLKQDKEVLQLKIILYVSVLLIIIIGLVIRSKVRTRKIHFMKEKQDLEKKQQAYEIEIKNKELVSSALQLVERDALLEGIRKKLISTDFKGVNQKIMNSLISTINANKAKTWNEFELYFTNVNEDYYQNLKENYSGLSATDLKMCALIKLGLSSKEMADIMGISSDSVNTSRSRIRKKMNLGREVNLTEFLSAM